jgi:hypothetical protein
MDLAPERKEGFEQAIRNSHFVLKQLYHIVDQWEEQLNAAESKITDYDTPSWEAKQAHRNGDRSRLRKLRDLLSFLKEK